MNTKLYMPMKVPTDFQQFLADKEGHWKTRHSAVAIAYSWSEAEGFPKIIERIFKESPIKLFRSLEMLFGFPEHKVAVGGKGGTSHSDLFVLAGGLARGKGQLVSIAVEGKAKEDFGRTVRQWLDQNKTVANRKKRLAFLLKTLGLESASVDNIRYQLLHRTASALIEAERFTAPNALMLVHSFSESDVHFDDYKNFVRLFGLNENVSANSIVGPVDRNGIALYFAWVRGDKKYLEKRGNSPEECRLDGPTHSPRSHTAITEEILESKSHEDIQ